MGNVWEAGAWADGTWADGAWADAPAPPPTPPAPTSFRFRGSVKEMLEAAVLACCCQQGSGSGSGQGGHPVSCCPGIVLPNVIHATIAGTAAFDGTYALTWTESPGFPENAGTVTTATTRGWYSERIYQFTCDFFGLYDIYSWIVFDENCNCFWKQFARAQSSGAYVNEGFMMPGGGACLFSFVCDPFYLRAGLTRVGNGAGGFSATPLKTCSTTELRHTCDGGTSTPTVELSL